MSNIENNIIQKNKSAYINARDIAEILTVNKRRATEILKEIQADMKERKIPLPKSTVIPRRELRRKFKY